MTHFKDFPSLSTIDNPLISRSMYAFMAFCNSVSNVVSFENRSPNFAWVIVPKLYTSLNGWTVY